MFFILHTPTKVTECISARPLFPAALVPEVFFLFISPIGIFKMSALKRYKPLTKPTNYEVDHNITNFDVKQKRI